MRKIYNTKEEAREASRLRTRKYYNDHKEYVKKREITYYNAHKKLKGMPTGENHQNWKGDNAGYFAIHKWVQQYGNNENRCEICKSTTKKRYEWANVDHKYKRVISDYLRLCHKCHYYYDVEHGLRKPIDWKAGIAARIL